MLKITILKRNTSSFSLLNVVLHVVNLLGKKKKKKENKRQNYEEAMRNYLREIKGQTENVETDKHCELGCLLLV